MTSSSHDAVVRATRHRASLGRRLAACRTCDERDGTGQPAKVTPFAGGNEAVSEKGPQATFSHLPGLREGDALIVVDVQRDFLPGGSLAIPAGDEVVAPLSAYIAAFDARNLPIFLTRDWHPENHCSFRNAGGRWPSHCVRGTPGADWPAELKFPVHTRIVSKGSDAVTEAYSGFSGTSLLTILRELGVRRLFVGGLATDYCVHDTVMDACLHGFEVVVLADAIRGVNAEPGDETRSIREMLARGATLFQPSVRRGASPRTGSQAGRTAIPPRGPP